MERERGYRENVRTHTLFIAIDVHLKSVLLQQLNQCYQTIQRSMSEKQTTFSRPAVGKVAKFICIANYVVGFVIIGLGVLGFFTILPNIVGLAFFMILTPFFMVLLGVMQICVELKIKFVISNFTFMNTLVGKGFFMLLYLLSSVMYCMLSVYQSFSPVIIFLICLPLLLFGLLYSFLSFCTCGKTGYSHDLKENLM